MGTRTGGDHMYFEGLPSVVRVYVDAGVPGRHDHVYDRGSGLIQEETLQVEQNLNRPKP